MTDGNFNHGCRGSSPQNIFQNSSMARENTNQPNEQTSRILASAINSGQNYCPPSEELLQHAIHNILSNLKAATKDNANSISQHDRKFKIIFLLVIVIFIF